MMKVVPEVKAISEEAADDIWHCQLNLSLIHI